MQIHLIYHYDYYSFESSMGNCISTICNQRDRDEEDSCHRIQESSHRVQESSDRVRKSIEEIFEEYEHQLIEALPMDDLIFLCMLRHHKVVPEDDLDCIETQLTESDKAAELFHLIRVDLFSYNHTRSLMKLLKVMNYFHSTNEEMQFHQSLVATVMDEIRHSGKLQ